MKRDFRRKRRHLSALLLGCFLWGLAAADTFPAGVILEPAPTHFSVCEGGGCHRVHTLAFTPLEWHRIVALFRPPTRSAARERVRIAQAIGRLERIVGAKTGTAADLGETFQGLGRPGQMDCIDESVNTTTYLLLLRHAGLLTWHTIEDRVTRGFFLFGWPHTTAVIRESGTGERYVVDSWFEGNGVPPYIIPLDPWRKGWRPLR